MTDVRLHLDANGQDMAIEHVQDVEPILDWNKWARTQEQKSDWGRHVARIPNLIMQRWLDEEYARGNVSLRMFTAEFDQIVQRKLKDPEWAFLKVDRPASTVGWQK